MDLTPNVMLIFLPLNQDAMNSLSNENYLRSLEKFQKNLQKISFLYINADPLLEKNEQKFYDNLSDKLKKLQEWLVNDGLQIKEKYQVSK